MPKPGINMRKIMSEEEREAKNIKNKRILAWIIGIIMLFSTASYAFMSFDGSKTKQEKINIGGIDFVKTDYGSWKFVINNQEFETLFNPSQTADISVSIDKTLQEYSGKPLYFGINSMEDSASSGNSEIINVIGNYISAYQYSCLSENCTEDYPVKNCDSNNVIVFKKSDKLNLYETSNCTVLEFEEGNETRAADAFIFNLLGFRTKVQAEIG